MNDSSIEAACGKSGPEYCSDCGKPIPDEYTFCPYCGPPGDPGEKSDEGMGFGQTFIRISLIVTLFGAIVVYKLDLGLFSGAGDGPSSGPVMKSSDGTKSVKPHAVDFKTIHKISAARSMLRDKPAKDGKVLTILKKGAKVTIIDGNDDWWKVKKNQTVGWIPRKDMDTQIR